MVVVPNLPDLPNLFYILPPPLWLVRTATTQETEGGYYIGEGWSGWSGWSGAGVSDTGQNALALPE